MIQDVIQDDWILAPPRSIYSIRSSPARNLCLHYGNFFLSLDVYCFISFFFFFFFCEVSNVSRRFTTGSHYSYWAIRMATVVISQLQQLDSPLGIGFLAASNSFKGLKDMALTVTFIVESVSTPSYPWLTNSAYQTPPFHRPCPAFPSFSASVIVLRCKNRFIQLL